MKKIMTNIISFLKKQKYITIYFILVNCFIYYQNIIFSGFKNLVNITLEHLFIVYFLFVIFTIIYLFYIRNLTNKQINTYSFVGLLKKITNKLILIYNLFGKLFKEYSIVFYIILIVISLSIIYFILGANLGLLLLLIPIIFKIKGNIKKIPINDKDKESIKRLSYIEEGIIEILPTLIILFLAISLYYNDEFVTYINTTNIIILIFIGIFLLFFLLSIYLANKIGNYKLIIFSPFSIIILSFFILLTFGVWFYDISFFINDFFNIINPYLMTYGFLLYGSLLGYYISKEKKDSIYLLSWFVLIYLLFLLFIYFYYNFISSDSGKKYIRVENLNECNDMTFDYEDNIIIEQQIDNSIRGYNNKSENLNLTNIGYTDFVSKNQNFLSNGLEGFKNCSNNKECYKKIFKNNKIDFNHLNMMYYKIYFSNFFYKKTIFKSKRNKCINLNSVELSKVSGIINAISNNKYILTNKTIYLNDVENNYDFTYGITQFYIKYRLNKDINNFDDAIDYLRMDITGLILRLGVYFENIEKYKLTFNEIEHYSNFGFNSNNDNNSKKYNDIINLIALDIKYIKDKQGNTSKYTDVINMYNDILKQLEILSKLTHNQ